MTDCTLLITYLQRIIDKRLRDYIDRFHAKGVRQFQPRVAPWGQTIDLNH